MSVSDIKGAMDGVLPLTFWRDMPMSAGRDMWLVGGKRRGPSQGYDRGQVSEPDECPCATTHPALDPSPGQIGKGLRNYAEPLSRLAPSL
jgi:hypothetical protein